MGKKIVIQKSSNEIGKQSRWWCIEDIYEVLGENKVSPFAITLYICINYVIQLTIAIIRELNSLKL